MHPLRLPEGLGDVQPVEPDANAALLYRDQLYGDG
jgi:hypothetical protein